MHLFGKWHARRWKTFHEEGSLSISSFMCFVYELKTKKGIKEQIDKYLYHQLDEKYQQVWGKHWNNTIPVSLILSCSTRTGSHSFSRCWVLLSIASFKNMSVLIIFVFKENKIFVVAQRIWRYFIRWALRNWHTRNFIKHCVVLWFYSRQKFHTDIDVQRKINVILTIKSFFGNWTSLSSPE